MHAKVLLLALTTLLLVACGDGGGSPDAGEPGEDAGGDAGGDLDAGDVVRAVIGPFGGSLQMDDGLSVVVPPAAVDAPTEFTITRKAAAGDAVSALYDIAPDGLVFARPVYIAMPVKAGTTAGTLYWSTRDGGYEPIGGNVSSGVLNGEIVHLSAGYVGPPASSRAVQGSRVLTYLWDTGMTNIPATEGLDGVVALVEDGGTYTQYSGYVWADGTFAIPSVPLGEYMLRAGNDFVVTTESTVDLGRLLPGRPDARSGEAAVSVYLSNLTPWAAGDVLDLHSAGANAFYSNLETEAKGAPDAGDTSILGMLVETRFTSNRNLIEGTKGDVAYVAHRQARTSDAGVPYTAVVEAHALPAFTQQPDGGTPVVAGAFTPAAARPALAFDVRFSQFATHQAELSNSSASLRGSVVVEAQPGSNHFGRNLGSAAPLAFVRRTDVTDFATGGLEYGSPFGTGWGEYVRVGVSPVVGYTHPTLGGMRYFFPSLRTYAPADVLAASPVTPRISPARDARINGVSIFTAQSAVGVTPEFTWTPPSVGTPNLYNLVVYDLDAPVSTVFARFTTRNTRLRIPAGVLEAGHYYVFLLQAVVDGNAERATAPFREHLPTSFADALSAPIGT